MGIDIYWGSGSPFGWSVLLTLEHKGLAYQSHVLQFSKKEHKNPEILKMNPRGKVPVLKDGDFSIYESQAIMQYLDKKYPEKPLYGRTPEETGKILQSISEFTSYVQKPMIETILPFLFAQADYKAEDILKNAEVAHQELANLNERLQKSAYLCGTSVTAADFIIYPHVKLFIRGNEKDEAKKHNLGFLPFAKKFPQLAQWQERIEKLPGYEKTYPPHWRQS